MMLALGAAATRDRANRLVVSGVTAGTRRIDLEAARADRRERADPIDRHALAAALEDGWTLAGDDATPALPADLAADWGVVPRGEVRAG